MQGLDNAQPDLAAALIVAAQNGSDYAFTRLVCLYQSPVRALLRRLCGGDHAAADDLAQQVFLRAHQKIASYSATGSFVGWLYKIGYRAFLDHERKLKRRRIMAARLAPEDSTTAEAHPMELKLDLNAALAGLRPEERAAITLCLSEGLSHEEAAHVMDMPLGTVKSHVTRGRKKLKKTLDIWRPKRRVTQ